MFGSTVSNIIIFRVFLFFETFHDVMDNNWSNFRKRIRRGGEEIINGIIINKRDPYVTGKVS